MNKKAVYSILSVIVAMMVLSVSLVFAIGPRVSADEGEPTIGVLDKAEYFNITYEDYNEELGYAPVVLSGLSLLGDEYIGQYGNGRCENFDKLCIVVPDGVTEIRGFFDWPYGYYTLFGAFSYFNSEEKGQYYYNYSTYAVSSVILPDTLRVIDRGAFYCAKIKSIIIPENVTTIGFEPTYSLGDLDIFKGCGDLVEIIVQNPDLLENENLQMWKDIMRYEAPKCTVTFDTVGGNTIESQNVTKNEMAMEPTVPTKDGYEFKGWLLNGEPYDFATPVTADMTLTAKWEEVQAQPESPVEENSKDVKNQNNFGLIAGIAGTSVGVLIIAGIVFGIVIAKRRRK